QPRAVGPVVGGGIPAAGAVAGDLRGAVRAARAGGAPRGRPAREGRGGGLPPPGRVAAGGGVGGGAGPGDVGRRDRPSLRGPFRLAAGGRTRWAGAAPDPACRGGLELEPPRAGRAGGDAGVVGVPRRFHRGGRGAPARRRGAGGPGASGRPVAAAGGRHLVGHALPDVGDRQGVQHGAAGGGRRDGRCARWVPRVGTRLRRGASRVDLRRRSLLVG